MDVVFESCLFG